MAVTLLLISVYGCTTVLNEKDVKEARRNPALNSQFTLYLNGPAKTSVDILFVISEVKIVSDNGRETEVLGSPVNIRSVDIAGSQILLGEIYLPEGEFKELQIVIKEASIKGDDSTASLALPSDGISSIPIKFKTVNRQNTTLFLNWNPDGSVTDGYLFSPSFLVSKEVPELSSLLVYVTNEGSDNVSVINRQSGKVVGTVMVGSRPRGIAAGLRDDRLRIYVANSGSNSISVINPNTNIVENEILLRYGMAPESIAVAKGPSENELIFVANYGSNSVSVIDAVSFQEMEGVNVGNGPIAIAVDPPIDVLSGVRFLDPDDLNSLRNYRAKFLNIYVVNKESNSVSVLRVDMLNSRVEDVLDVDVEWNPISLSVDYRRGKVYVANFGSDKLSVIDILSIINFNSSVAVGSIDNIGHSTIGVVANPVFDRLYLLKSLSSEVVFTNPYSKTGDRSSSVITPVLGSASTGLSPRAFMLDPESRNLYVVNSGSNSVSVINVTTKNQDMSIPVGIKPYGIAMFMK